MAGTVEQTAGYNSLGPDGRGVKNRNISLHHLGMTPKISEIYFSILSAILDPYGHSVNLKSGEVFFRPGGQTGRQRLQNQSVNAVLDTPWKRRSCFLKAVTVLIFLTFGICFCFTLLDLLIYCNKVTLQCITAVCFLRKKRQSVLFGVYGHMPLHYQLLCCISRHKSLHT